MRLVGNIFSNATLDESCAWRSVGHSSGYLAVCGISPSSTPTSTYFKICENSLLHHEVGRKQFFKWYFARNPYTAVCRPQFGLLSCMRNLAQFHSSVDIFQNL